MSSPEFEEQKHIFAENLKRELECRDKNQTDLAAFIGVSSATTSDWINGKKMPRMDKIQSMANWFGIPKSGLLEEMSPEDVLNGDDGYSELRAATRHYVKPYAVTEEEFDVLSLYKKLDDKDRIKIVERMQTLLEDEKYKKASMEGSEVG